MKTLLSLLIINALTCIVSVAQIGGTSTYQFLNLNPSARLIALGGQAISIPDNDLNTVLQNPALLNEEMDNHLALNYINYIADINYGYAAWAVKTRRAGMLGIGMLYLNYGQFDETDEQGNILGTFHAADYALNLSWALRVDSLLTLGVNVKPIISVLERYTSTGLAFDLGAWYKIGSKGLNAGIVLRNAGFQIKPYTEDTREPLPFEFQAGISQKLPHAPFRYQIVYRYLDTWKLTYESELNKPRTDPVTGEEETDSRLAQFGDNLMRHIVLGVEFVPSEKFYVAVGYNYKLRQELAFDDRPGAVGLSWGTGLKIRKFRVGYGSTRYHLAGPVNVFSITTNLSELSDRL